MSLQQFVSTPDFDEYKETFKDFFKMTRRDDGVLLVEAHTLDRLRGAESFVEFCTVSNVFQFDLKVCAALTRLGVLDLGGAPKPALMLDDIARSDCVAVDFHRSVAAVLLKFSSGAVYRPLRMRAQWRA